MKKATIEKANQILTELKQIDEALRSFEYQATPEDEIIDLEPKLLIEHIDYYEFDGRVQTRIPGYMSKEIIDIIKNHLRERFTNLEVELEQLTD